MSVTRSQAALTAEKLAELKDVPGFAAAFLPDGKPPKQGDTLKQSALAATLDHLAHAGLDDFYRGDVGREIAADLERIGSPVTRDDLARYRAGVAEPLSVKLAVRHGLQHAAADPGAGVADDPRAVRAAARRGSRELRLRARPGRMHQARVPRPRPLLSPIRRGCRIRRTAISIRSFSTSRSQKIDRRKAAKWPAPAGEGDTIWMGAADASGLVVSYIQSLYWEFGSGCVLPATGVLMQNRGASFSLDPKAVNPLQPGRLPFHTLNPALAVLGDGRVMAYGTMGGDGQPQTQGHAVCAPRAVPPAARQGARRAALAARPHLGLDRDQPADGDRASTAT